MNRPVDTLLISHARWLISCVLAPYHHHCLLTGGSSSWPVHDHRYPSQAEATAQ